MSEEMDLTKYLPDISAMQDSLVPWMRFFVILGPMIMLLLGLYYFFLSPKEVSHDAGYRFRYAMSQTGVWQTAQRLAGLAYGSAGLVLTVLMLVLSFGFSHRTPPSLVWFAVKCIFWEVILTVVVTLAVNIFIVMKFDHKGNPRKKKTGASPTVKKQ